jgi:PAS domain S-box-containing protein
VNPAYYQLLGYSESEIASLTFDEITHPDDLGQDLHYMEQINQGKIDSFRLEKRYLRKNGEVMWGNLTLTVLRDQDGKPGFCLGMIEDITERKHAEDQIKASLQEKETLLKEIHHRVKNNLQIISSLLRLQSRQLQDQQAIALFQESQNRVQAMALIHEKLYQSSNLAQIDFQEYIKTLVQALFRSYDAHRHGVTFKCNVEPVSLALDTAIPCGLIINELVSNSLKYAFPETLGGEICISLQSLEHRFSNPGKTSPPAPFLQGEGSQTPPSLQGNRSFSDSEAGRSPEVGGSGLNYRIDVLEPQSSASVDPGEFILTLSDNGVGLSENFDFRNTSSLGLQLVCRLTKQLEASIELNRSYGTEFKISFRNPNHR